MDEDKYREYYQSGSSTTGDSTASADKFSKRLQEIADQSSSGEEFLSPESSSGRMRAEYIDRLNDVSPGNSRGSSPKAHKDTSSSPKGNNYISSPKAHKDASSPKPNSYNSSPKAHKDASSSKPNSYSSSPKAHKDGSSPKSNKDGSNKQPDKDEPKVGQTAHIDTASPFESVREAVSKFGVIVDWKAHRAQTNERRLYIEQELEKARDEIPAFKQKSEEAEKAKDLALRELDSTKRLIEELKLNLERAQTEERQAKQDSELAQLRVTEMEQGVADESSVAAKTQLEVAKARHQAAASELVTVRNSLTEIRRDYAVLIAERDTAIQKAKESVSQSKEIERSVEDLTIQLITTKEAIESTHASHLEAEEQRIAEAMSRDQDALNWDKQLKLSEEDLEKVKQQIVFAKDLRSKLESSSVLLYKLKEELAVYMQGNSPAEINSGSGSNSDSNFTRIDIQSGVAVAKKNLDEVNQNIEKVKEEIMNLKTATESLTAQLETEKATLTQVRKQKGLGAGAVSSLESELKRTRIELDEIQKKEKEARAKLTELPKELKKVTEEAERAKSMTEGARRVLKKAKEATDQTKSEASTMSHRLAAAQKEIETARAAEKLALGAISALQESQSARALNFDDSKGGVTISLEEYYELSKKGQDAEEAANKRVADAMAMIDEAKDSEMQSLNKLTQLNSELASRKEALNVALEKAELAKESKLNIEEELKKRKGETDQKKNKSSQGGFFRGSKDKDKDKENGNPDSTSGTTSNLNLKLNVNIASSLKSRFGARRAAENKNKENKNKESATATTTTTTDTNSTTISTSNSSSMNPFKWGKGENKDTKSKESKESTDSTTTTTTDTNSTSTSNSNSMNPFKWGKGESKENKSKESKESTDSTNTTTNTNSNTNSMNLFKWGKGESKENKSKDNTDGTGTTDSTGTTTNSNTNSNTMNPFKWGKGEKENKSKKTEESKESKESKDGTDSMSESGDTSPDGKGSKKKKRAAMPKFFMFMGKDKNGKKLPQKNP